MAEYVMKDLIEKKGLCNEFLIQSAATSREEIGNDIHCGTKRKLDEMHISYDLHHARQLNQSDYQEYDYILGMDDANIRNILRITGGDSEHKICSLCDFTNHPRAIADPWYTGDFDATYLDIVDGCEALLQRSPMR